MRTFMRIVLGCFLAFGCSPVNEDDKNNDEQQPGGGGQGNATLQLRVQALNGGKKASTVAAATYSLSPDQFQSTSIASGPPTSFTINLKKMTLYGTVTVEGKDNRILVPIFESATGKPIAITGSRVDLSDMFTKYDCIDNNGSAYTLQAGESCECGFDGSNKPLGKVSKLAEDGLTQLEVCPYDVEGYAGGRGSGGKIATIDAQAGNFTSLQVVFERKAKIMGCVTGRYGSPDSTINGVHTYCTREGFPFYENVGGGQNSDFENQTPEEMDFDLSLGKTVDTSTEISIDFPIQGGLNLAAGASAPLTLLIDTNRMLRFTNQARSDQGAGPGSPTDRSYFFTTVFGSSIYLFAGAPGKIYGYQMLTAACTQTEDADVPDDFVCTSNPFVVALWLTMVTDGAGTPLTASFMPDDDNTLTVVKGSTSHMGSDNQWGWDPAAFTKNESGNYDIHFWLGAEDNGMVYNVSTDVDVDEALTGVKFRGLQKSYGVITAHRRL